MRAAPGSPADRAAAWIRNEIAAGRSVPHDRSADFLVALASGRADGSSGRYLTVLDDLDVLMPASAVCQSSATRTRQVEAVDEVRLNAQTG